MTGRFVAVRAGALDVSPALLGNVPWGLAFGAAAVDIGLTPTQAVAMSALVFAGSAQLAAIDLLGRDVAPAVIVIAALLINLRFVIYSAGLAPVIAGAPLPSRAALTHLVTDLTFAFGGLEVERNPGGHHRAYLLGVGLPLWGSFLLATAVGALLGALIPPWLGIDFVIPLIFIGLVVPAIDSRARLAAAAVGGGVAAFGGVLPYGTGLLVAILAGVAAGLLARTGGR